MMVMWRRLAVNQIVQPLSYRAVVMMATMATTAPLANSFQRFVAVFFYVIAAFHRRRRCR
jgi:hypothetical protein